MNPNKQAIGNKSKTNTSRITPEELYKRIDQEKLKEWKANSKLEVEVPKVEPIITNTSNTTYSFLEGNFAKKILKEYNSIAKDEYKNSSALKVLSSENDIVKGSNPFSFILLNKVLQNHKKWVAKPTDLEKALEKEILNLKGTYGDSALILRSENNPNEYLAKNLASQIKQKGYEIKDSLMIPLAGLDLKYDENSSHNLIFQLTDSTEIISAPQLNKSNHEKEFNSVDEKGLPIFEDNGSRTLYSSEENGLCRLYRCRVLGLDARYSDLADSNSDGRVVVCAEGTSK